MEHLFDQLPGGVLGFLIVVNLMVFTLAFFLDFFEIAFIVVPLVDPIAYKLGIDPIWSGGMLAVNMQTAFMHPPFGFALFYLKSVAPKSIRTADIYWGAIPFLVIQLVMVAVVLAFPQVVLRDPPPDASSVTDILIDVDPDAGYLPAEGSNLRPLTDLDPSSQHQHQHHMTPFEHTFITGTSSFLPGEPVDNAAMDQFIGSINRVSGRIKQRILAENGIQTRHYALDAAGNSLHSVTSMGAEVVRSLIAEGTPVEFLAAATTGGDCAAPGLANLIQGELHLPPMETTSVSGICAASIGALKAAALAVESGSAQTAIAVASEFPSRLFKASRFRDRSTDVDFDAHFLSLDALGRRGRCCAFAPARANRSLLEAQMDPPEIVFG